MTRAPFGLMVALMLAAAPPALSQTPPAPAMVDPLPAAAYEPQLMRLSEIMGALHHLRAVCPGGDTGQWREEMQRLLDIESQSPVRRERMTQMFNRGFTSLEQSHRTCQPTTREIIRRHVNEGHRLVRELQSRFAN